METTIVSLWKGDYQPDDGWVDGDFQSIIMSGEESDELELLTWRVLLKDDSIMFELYDSSGCTCIWMGYSAIADRKVVLEVITEARATLPVSYGYDRVWSELIELIPE